MIDDIEGSRVGRDDPAPQDAECAGGGTVVHLESASPDPERILTGLRGYWEGLRGRRAVPDRSDVEPQGMRQALDYAFILERIAPGAARFRLAGRHLVDLMGMEVRGMPLCAVLNPAGRGRFSDVLETVFKGPQIIELTLRSTAAYGRPALDGRMLLLPLKSDLGDVTRALGCLVSTGHIGRGPRRFDVLGEDLSPVIEGAEPLAPRSDGFDTPHAAKPAPRPIIVRRVPPPRPRTPEECRAMFRVVTEKDR